MRRVNADIIVALLAIAVGGATLLLVPDQVSGATLSALADAQSAAFFPIVAGLLMLTCGFVLLAEAVLDQRGGGVHVTIVRPVAVAVAVCIVVGFAVATHYIGMSVASGVAILLMGLFIEPARWRLVVPSAVVVPVVIYMLFERLLLILLPEGTLF